MELREKLSGESSSQARAESQTAKARDKRLNEEPWKHHRYMIY